jgi:hypothetical protein
MFLERDPFPGGALVKEDRSARSRYLRYGSIDVDFSA